MSLLVVFSFHLGDLSLAEANAEWIAELGGVSDFPCLIVTTTDTNYAKVHRTLAGAFRSVEVLALDNIEYGVPPERRWPICANRMFNQASIAAQAKGMPFLFLEADACPTRVSWLKELDAAYRAHGLPFFGMRRPTILPRRDGTLEPMGEHMVGMGIYPADFRQYSDMVASLPTTGDPFDIWLQGEIVYGGGAASQRPVKGCCNTPLMSHHWSTRNWRIEDGVIKLDKDKDYAICDEPDLRPPAICHGCKDDSLIKLLRSQRDGAMALPVKPQAPPVDEVAEAYKAGQLEASKPLPPGLKVNPDYVTASHVGLLVGPGAPSLDAQIEHDAGVQSVLEGKSIIHGTPAFADELAQAVREGKLDQSERETRLRRYRELAASDALSREELSEYKALAQEDIDAMAEQTWCAGGDVDDPYGEMSYIDRALSKFEPAESLVAPEVVAGEQVEEVHASEKPVSEETILHAEIREKSDNGVKFHTLMKDYKLTSKKLKAILNNP